MTFIIGTFQFHCKSEQHIKQREIKSHGTYANQTLFFFIYKVVHYFNDFWKLFLDNVYLKNEWQQFPRKNLFHIISFRKFSKKLDTFSSAKLQLGARIKTIFRLSWKYFNRISITMKRFLKHLVCFEYQNHVMLF